MKRKLIRAVLLLAVLSFLTGMLGCGKTPNCSENDIVSVSSTCGHMDYSFSYSFYAIKKGENWLFSASCAVDTESPRTEFEDCPITSEDAQKLLRIIMAQNDTESLKSYKEPLLRVRVSDETTYYSSIAFSDGENISAPKKLSDDAVEYFYQLAKKYSGTAETTVPN